jgi:hypothetical protein
MDCINLFSWAKFATEVEGIYIEGIKAHRNEQDNVVVVSVVARKEVENDTDVTSPFDGFPDGSGEVVELIEKCAKSTGWGIFYLISRDKNPPTGCRNHRLWLGSLPPLIGLPIQIQGARTGHKRGSTSLNEGIQTAFKYSVVAMEF